jgi:leucine-rich repeat protein SHOC2
MPVEMDRIGRLQSMEVLQMSLNGVRTIPESIGTGKLQYVLRELHLEFNKIRDLPKTLCSLIKLEKLYLGNNSIEKLPKNIGDCKNLKILRLQFNKIKHLPNSIGKCSFLDTLWLNNNNLTDLPNELGHCPLLADIKARNNSDELDKKFNWYEGKNKMFLIFLTFF